MFIMCLNPLRAVSFAVQALQSQTEKTATQEEARHSQSQNNEVAQEVLPGIRMVGSRQLNPAREVDDMVHKGDSNKEVKAGEEIEPHFGCKEAQL